MTRISHHELYLRLASLQAANDRISNAIAQLPIFEHYAFDLETPYGGVLPLDMQVNTCLYSSQGFWPSAKVFNAMADARSFLS